MTPQASLAVLLVEDHPDNRDMYSLMLRSVGCSVIEAANGDEALAQASAHPPSIVVTDLRMPGAVTSLDVCRHFAALGVPVIVVTGVTPGPEYDEVEGAGCAAVPLETDHPRCARRGDSPRPRVGGASSGRITVAATSVAPVHTTYKRHRRAREAYRPGVQCRPSIIDGMPAPTRRKRSWRSRTRPPCSPTCRHRRRITAPALASRAALSRPLSISSAIALNTAGLGPSNRSLRSAAVFAHRCKLSAIRSVQKSTESQNTTRS